jgi:transposase
LLSKDEVSYYCSRLSALVGLLGSTFPIAFYQDPGVADPLLGVEICRGAIAAIRQRMSAALAQPMAEALDVDRLQPVAYVVEEVLRRAVETGALPASGAGSGS